MRILDRYIAKQVIPVILLTSAILVALDLFFVAVDELKMVGIASYSWAEAALYLSLTLPRRFYIMFPWAALIGSLLSLGSLATHSELVAMRVASISPGRIAWSVLKAAVIVNILAFTVGEGLAPGMERYAQARRTQALSDGQALNTAFGTWVRSTDEFIHIKQILSKDELLGVTRFQLDQGQKLGQISFAARAYREDKLWRLEYVKTTYIKPEKLVTDVEYEQVLDRFVEPELIEHASQKHLRYVSLRGLWRTIKERNLGGLEVESFEFALWSKLLQPITVMIMVLLAVPCIFGPLRRANNGLRILIGMALAFIFHTINGIAGPLAHFYQVPSWLSAALTPGLFALMALGLMYKLDH